MKKIELTYCTNYNGWSVEGIDELSDQIEDKLCDYSVDLCDDDGYLDYDIDEQKVVDIVNEVVSSSEKYQIHITYDEYSS